MPATGAWSCKPKRARSICRCPRCTAPTRSTMPASPAPRCFASDLSIEDDAFARGIARAPLACAAAAAHARPARAHFRAEGGEVWVDGGHNAHAAARARARARRHEPQARRATPRSSSACARARTARAVRCTRSRRTRTSIIAVPLERRRMSRPSELAAAARTGSASKRRAAPSTAPPPCKARRSACAARADLWLVPAAAEALALERGASDRARPRAAAQTLSFSHSTIFDFGIAPTFVAATLPSLNTIKVGMPRTP